MIGPVGDENEEILLQDLEWDDTEPLSLTPETTTPSNQAPPTSSNGQLTVLVNGNYNEVVFLAYIPPSLMFL